MPLVGRANAEWRQQRWLSNADLQVDAVVANVGRWQPVEGLWPLTIVIGGSFTSFVGQLRVCNAKRRPPDSETSKWPSLFTVSEQRVITLEQPFKWIKFELAEIVVGDDDLGVSVNYAAGGQGA